MDSVLNYGRSRNELVAASMVISLPILIVLIFVFTSGGDNHWFVFPLMICGILTFWDASLWIRGKVEVFDPVGIVGLFGVFFFFLAPLLHIRLDYWMTLVPHPSDWRDWLGGMAIINAIGLVVYRWSRNLSSRKTINSKWIINKNSAVPTLVFSIIIAAALQVWFYSRYGGVFQFIKGFDQSEADLSGLGLLFTFSESLPFLLGILILILIQSKSNRRTIIFAVIFLVILFVIRLYFGGFRGSRNTTIWYLFWIVCLYHNMIRPFSKKIMILGIVFITLFMYLYGFYKSGGIGDVQSAISGNSAAMEQQTGRSTGAVFLGDYGRSDVQAILLRTVTNTEYPLAFGRSYLGDLFKMIPPIITNKEFPSKRDFGTQAQFYGYGLPHDGYVSTRLYGLTGEWMLNFGYYTTPIAFFLFGLFVGWVRKLYRHMDRDDARFLLLPLLINLSFLALVNDLDNHLFFLFKNGVIPGIIIFLVSKKIKSRRTSNEKTPSIHTNPAIPNP